MGRNDTVVIWCLHAAGAESVRWNEISVRGVVIKSLGGVRGRVLLAVSLVAAVVLGAGRRRHVLAERHRVFPLAFKLVLLLSVVVPFHLHWLRLALYPVLVLAASFPGRGAVFSVPAPIPLLVFFASFR